ncbi:MAG TPA: hypothetical protein VLT82_13150 [Myxococcaceae bacterium]|nr:hypothetical protein [Myxococcaceae bacterium]
MRIMSWLAAGALALAVGCASSNTTSSPGTASVPPATSHPAVAGGPKSTVSGEIQNYTTGPSGQQNGFVLGSGQRVHVPEEMGSKVSDQFPPNTQVNVTGYMTTDSDGRPILEADTIAAPDRNATLDLASAHAAPPSPAWGPSVGGSGPAGSQPVNPPAETQPGTPGNPPPGGR